MPNPGADPRAIFLEVAAGVCGAFLCIFSMHMPGSNPRAICGEVAAVFSGAFLFFILVLMLRDLSSESRRRGHGLTGDLEVARRTGGGRRKRDVSGPRRAIGGVSFSGASSPTSVRPLNSRRQGSSSTPRRIQSEEQGASLTYLVQPVRHGADSQHSFADLAALSSVDSSTQGTRPSDLLPDWEMAAVPSLEPLELGASATELGGQNVLLEFARKKSSFSSPPPVISPLPSRVSEGQGKLRDEQRARISSGTRFLVRGMSTDSLPGFVKPPRSGDTKSNELNKRRKMTRDSHSSAQEQRSEETPRTSGYSAHAHESRVGSSSAPRWLSYSKSHFPRQYAGRNSETKVKPLSDK